MRNDYKRTDQVVKVLQHSFADLSDIEQSERLQHQIESIPEDLPGMAARLHEYCESQKACYLCMFHVERYRCGVGWPCRWDVGGDD